MFQTSQTREQFIPNWLPFAKGFLRTGLQNIVLAESESQYKFISRNLWTKTAFERTFGTNRIANGGGNGIRAMQAGAYRTTSLSGLGQARKEEKIMAFFNSNNLKLLKEKLLEISKNQNAIILEPANQSAVYELILKVYNPSLLEQIMQLKPAHIATYREMLTLP